MLRGIDKVMANFVWNSQGERRAHWISWDSVCIPIDEGGLGITKFDTVRNTLHAKLLWQVLAGNSIMWSRYAKSKYFRSSEPYHTSNQSPLWKSVISHYQTLGDHSRWIVGKGELRFWRDNWCGERLGGPQPCDETLLVTQRLTIIDDLVESIPSQLRTLVSRVQLDPTQQDRLVFTAAESGKFSSKAFRVISTTRG